jgi:hypothetical protein
LPSFALLAAEVRRLAGELVEARSFPALARCQRNLLAEKRQVIVSHLNAMLVLAGDRPEGQVRPPAAVAEEVLPTRTSAPPRGKVA